MVRLKMTVLRKFNVTEQLKVKCETCNACSIERQKMKSQTSGFPQQELDTKVLSKLASMAWDIEKYQLAYNLSEIEDMADADL